MMNHPPTHVNDENGVLDGDEEDARRG